MAIPRLLFSSSFMLSTAAEPSGARLGFGFSFSFHLSFLTAGINWIAEVKNG